MSEHKTDKLKDKAISGHELEIDISDAACEPFGFKHGDHVEVIGFGFMGEVIGVAPCPAKTEVVAEGENVLWFKVDGQEAVSFVPDPKNELRPIPVPETA